MKTILVVDNFFSVPGEFRISVYQLSYLSTEMQFSLETNTQIAAKIPILLKIMSLLL